MFKLLNGRNCGPDEFFKIFTIDLIYHLTNKYRKFQLKVFEIMKGVALQK